MSFGEYLKALRRLRGLTQKELAGLAGFSNTELSRIESGDRKKPSPAILRAVAHHLGVSSQDLFKRAGYLEEVIEHEGYVEHVFTDEDGQLADIVRRVKQMQEVDSDWVNISYRVSRELPEEDLEAIKAIASSLLRKNEKRQ